MNNEYEWKSQEWYNLQTVKYKLKDYTYNREVAFIEIPSRNIIRKRRIHNMKGFEVYIKSLHIDLGRKYNMYYSLAKYKNGVPYGSLNFSKDKDNPTLNYFWKVKYYQEMESYDFLLDIDADSQKEIGYAYYSAKQIKILLDKFNVPYYLRFSGCGFHFIIPYKFFPQLSFDPFDNTNIYLCYKQIAQKIKSKFSHMIDLGIYDSKRLVKIPYSLAFYDNEYFLSVPFNNDNEFDNFKLENMKPNNYYKYLELRKEKLFNEQGNLNKLFETFDIKWSEPHLKVK